MNKKLLIIVLTLLFTSITVSAKDKAPKQPLDPASGRGVLVVSLTMPIFNGMPTKYAQQAYYYQGVGEKRFSPKAITVYHKVFLGKAKQSDFDNEFGILVVLDMKAGDYEFKEWHFTNGNGDRISASLFLHPFTITAGRATYVGQIDLSVRKSKNMLGTELLVDPVVSLLDSTERDLAVLAQKFPFILKEQIDVSLLRDSQKQNADDENTTSAPCAVNANERRDLLTRVAVFLEQASVRPI